MHERSDIQGLLVVGSHGFSLHIVVDGSMEIEREPVSSLVLQLLLSSDSGLHMWREVRLDIQMVVSIVNREV